ncbi:MAG: YdeI family protein [Candidatus Dormibacteria bacterium]
MTPTVSPRPEFFLTPEDLATWYEANPSASELWVGFWKKGFERPGVSYSDAVDEALCNGWIDSVIRRVDEAAYMLRFTPRRPKSKWTDANLRRVGELRAAGRLRPAGERAVSAALDAAKRSGR